MNSTYLKTREFSVDACFAAIAFLLMFIEIPVIPVVSYLKLDFSDIPVLLGTVIYGPVSGIVIAVIKLLLHGLVRGFSPVELLGLFANLCTSLCLILPFAWSFKHAKWSFGRRIVVGGVIGTILMVVIMTVFNYYVLTPAYMQMFGWHPTLPVRKLMLVGVAPFNLIKGALVSLVFGLIVVHMKRFLNNK